MSEQRLEQIPRVFDLPNSTYIIKTKAGSVLVNCPPETLKYITASGFDIPEFILLPPDIPAGQELGSSGFVRKGISYASVEFLLYANFFIKSRRVVIFTPTQNQADRLNVILQETFAGPSQDEQYGGNAWLHQECRAISYFPPMKRAPVHSDLCDVRTFEQEGMVDLGLGVTVEFDTEKLEYRFFENDEQIAAIPIKFQDTPRPLSMAKAQPVTKHQLTLQFIGGSDGFDPNGITTCFLAYLSQEDTTKATLFDTAAFIRMRLGNLGIAANQISEVVISHLHEDHLAGLPEILLMGDSRVKLITSDIIFDSLCRVLSAMLNLPTEEITALFDYIPVNPGDKVTIGDRVFESLYAVHSIPTIALRVNGLYYSGDMRYDESFFDELVVQKVLTDQRRKDLIAFGDGAEILVQDAGGGTIHTTVTPELLTSLAMKGQKVILAHTSGNPLPEEMDAWEGRVEIATTGHITSTGEANVEDPFDQIVATLKAYPLLRRLPKSEIQWLARHSFVQYWDDGEEIMSDGVSADNHLYVVHSGLIEIWQPNDGDLIQIVGRGSSVGELAFLSDSLNGINDYTAIAKYDTQLLRIDRDVFKPISIQLGLKEALSRAKWLKQRALFKDLLWSSLLDLSLDFQSRYIQVGETIFEQGADGKESFLLISGEVSIRFDGKHLDTVTTPGTFFGGRSALFKKPRTATGVALVDTELWALPQKALLYLHARYPNISLHLRAVELMLDAKLQSLKG